MNKMDAIASRFAINALLGGMPHLTLGKREGFVEKTNGGQSPPHMNTLTPPAPPLSLPTQAPRTPPPAAFYIAPESACWHIWADSLPAPPIPKHTKIAGISPISAPARTIFPIAL